MSKTRCAHRATNHASVRRAVFVELGKDRKWVTEFGASARRGDGKPDGGDVFELQTRVNAQVSGASKPETMREIAQELVSEAIQAKESAAQNGKQPPEWVRQFMSPAGWQHYRELRKEAGDSDETSSAITEPAAPTGG